MDHRRSILLDYSCWRMIAAVVPLSKPAEWVQFLLGVGILTILLIPSLRYVAPSEANLSELCPIRKECVVSFDLL